MEIGVSLVDTAMATSRKEPWCGNATYLNSWLEQLEEAFILEDLKGDDKDRKRVASLLTYLGRYLHRSK